ncbi:MAG: AAA family ATPase [Planctomycetota bacterium]
MPPEGVVVVCEGEKACDAGWSVGLPCVTSGAADSARSADWTSLRGRDVVILPDHDEPGAQYAEEVARQLKSLEPAASVKIVELPGLNEAEDLHDFINEHRDSRRADEIKAEIVALIASTPVYDAPNVPEARVALGKPSSERVPRERSPVVRCVADVKPETVEWLWQDRIAIGKVTLIAGDPGLGKSVVTLDIAARVSSGVPFHDTQARPNPPGGVVLLSAEDDVADTIRPRLDAAGADVRRIVIIDAVAEADAHKPSTCARPWRSALVTRCQNGRSVARTKSVRRHLVRRAPGREIRPL